MGQKYMAPLLEVSGLFDGWDKLLASLGQHEPFLFVASVEVSIFYCQRALGSLFCRAISFLYFIAIPMLTFLRARFVMDGIGAGFFGGRFLSGVWSWGWMRHRHFSVCSVCYGPTRFSRVQRGLLMMYDARYKAEAWMHANLPADVRWKRTLNYLPSAIASGINVHRSPFTTEALSGLRERSPDYWS